MTKTTLSFPIMPDFGPAIAFWSNQAELAIYMNARAMRTAMVPWQAMAEQIKKGPMTEVAMLPKPVVAQPKAQPKAKPTPAPEAPKTAAPKTAAPKVEAVAAPTPAPVKPAPAAAPKPVEAAAPVAPKPVAPKPAAPKPVEAAPAAKAQQAAPVAKTPDAPVAPKVAESPAQDVAQGTQPKGLKAARKGGADDLRQIKGVGPKLEEALNALGIYHYDQIAKWTEAEVLWADDNVPGARGRVSRDGWVAQAAALAEAGA